jgi:hypothetical protein
VYTYFRTGQSAGSTVDSVYTTLGAGPVLVYGNNPALGAVNSAMIFDSSVPTGGDDDLGTPNQVFGGPGIGIGGESGPYVNNVSLGNILIVSEDGDASDPDDADVPGAELVLDFSACGAITAQSITIVDVDGESAGASVDLYDDGGSLIVSFPIAESGDNGIQTIDLLSTAGVNEIVVVLNGSGAIDNVCFEKEITEPGCTRTIGYWKNHTGFGPQDDEVTALLPIYLGDMGGSASLYVDDAGMARDILKQNVYGSPSNGITKLYAQMLATKLNIESGADDADVAMTIAMADAFLADHDWTDWDSLSGADQTQVLGWKDTFDDYNNGDIGPGHCDD